MIKDIKLGLSLMKNGLNYYGAIAGVLIGIGGGLLFLLLLPLGLLSNIFIGIGVIAGVQLIYSLSVSTMVQSSPYKKRLRTTVPTWIAVISMLIANTIYILVEGVAYLRTKNNTKPYMQIVYEQGEHETHIVAAAVLMVLFLLLTVVMIRFFWISILLEWGGFGLFLFSMRGVEFSYLNISLEAAIILSYVIVLLGCGIMYVFNCLTYKKEYSELSFRGLLKRASN